MSTRIIAIGDIHGYSASLDAILEAVDPRPEDTIVTLGDYCDRGPDTQGVIERLIALDSWCRLVPILGNHDEMLLDLAAGDMLLLDNWLTFGGIATLASYDCASPEAIPEEHVAFLKRCPTYHESEEHFFVHGSYLSETPLDSQPRDVLLWGSLRGGKTPGPHMSGKTAVMGHTAQRDGQILDLGWLLCIDTCCYGGGWLSAIDLATRQLWQADQEGNLRGDDNP